MNKDEAKKNIQRLIDKYQIAVKAGRINKYSEEETKKDFILPLFEILGWDVLDKNEVSAEESQSSGGRVDYGFYLNTTPKFFLESKAFKQDIHKEEFAKQAVRYSWNKGVTWAVLTNFETIIVFNAQDIESRYLGDKRLFEISCNEYIKRFDQLWQLSRESLETNSIDKYAEQIGKKLQKVSISATLYKDLSICREMLTNSISISNPNVDKDLIDEGVQRLLDRLIFIRVAEDREIEPPTLIPLLREWETKHRGKIPVYQSMIKKFRELDKIYNSNLFLPHSFETWEEYGGATEKVVPLLYGKEGYYEYDFKVMPADVLGSVYENYLGYRLSKSKKGTTVNKDAKKRKEQGIYYTPTFIVDYIVKNSLKPVLDQCKSISDLKKIKVLDPACGSGSFLIKALEVISEKYKEFHYDDAYTKFQILTQNIYGVDLDEQAVEIAQLNLLINALDKRVKLPILTNIKNGNSLISGTDEELKKYFGKNYKDKKPFNWEEEFSEVFAQGGFDVIIGNPPYISYYSRQAQTDKNTKLELDFLINHYDFVEDKNKLGRLNTLMFFIERCIKNTKINGYVGLIVDTNLHSNPSVGIRKYILEKTQVLKIADEIKVFEDVASSQTVLVIRKSKPSLSQKIYWEHLEGVSFYSSSQANQSSISAENQFSFKERKGDIIQSFLLKIGKFPTIESLVGKNHIRTCITFTGKKSYFVKENKNSKNDYPLLEGSYSLAFPYAPIIYKNYINYNLELRDKLNEEYRKQSIKENKRSPMVIGLGNLEQFKSPKIFIRLSDKRVTASYTKEIVAADLSLYILTLPNLSDRNSELSLFYFLGVLNSKIVTFYMKGLNFIRNLTTGTPQIRLNDIRQIPIPIYIKNNNVENLAEKMLFLNKELCIAEENSNKWLKLKDEIKKTDKKIDAEVYKLYGLTPEEIKIVENSGN